MIFPEIVAIFRKKYQELKEAHVREFEGRLAEGSHGDGIGLFPSFLFSPITKKLIPLTPFQFTHFFFQILQKLP